MQKLRNLSNRTRAAIIVTIVLVIAIVIHWVLPTNPFDPFITTLLLVILFIWFGQYLVKSVPTPWGSFEIIGDSEKPTPEVKAEVDEAIKQTPPARATSIRWDKAATLFWLGNDLMWIKDMTFRGASPTRILSGVDNAIEYAIEIGFTGDTFPVQRLKIVKQQLQRLVNIPTATEGYPSIIQGYYGEVRQDIEVVKWYIHEVAINEKQPGFVKR